MKEILQSQVCLSFCYHFSDEVFIGIEVLILTSGVTDDTVEFHLVAEEATDTTEASAELVGLTALIGHQLNLETVVLVVHQQPVRKTFLTLDL